MVQLVKTPGCGPGGREFESHYSPHAGLAELADALDLGSSGNFPVKVQLLYPAPEKNAESSAFFCAYFTKSLPYPYNYFNIPVL